MTRLESVEDDGRELTFEGPKCGSVCLPFLALAIVVDAAHMIRVAHLIQGNDVQQSVELAVASTVNAYRLMTAARARDGRRSTAHREG